MRPAILVRAPRVSIATETRKAAVRISFNVHKKTSLLTSGYDSGPLRVSIHAGLVDNPIGYLYAAVNPALRSGSAPLWRSPLRMAVAWGDYRICGTHARVVLSVGCRLSKIVRQRDCRVGFAQGVRLGGFNLWRADRLDRRIAGMASEGFLHQLSMGGI